MYSHQFGFRANHSPELALLLLVDKVSDALEKGEREGGTKQKTLIDDLPLFAAAPAPVPQAPPQSSQLQSLLSEVHPDELTPREALDILYKLKDAAKP